MNLLRALGHSVTFDWTAYPAKKPFSAYPKEAAELSREGIDGILAADVFILLAHHDGPGVFTELGAALATYQLQQKPKIYAVAREIPEATFHFHPHIVWKQSIDEVLAEISPS